MARIGYIEARNTLERARKYLSDAEAKLAACNTLFADETPNVEALREIHRKDARKAIEGYRLALVEAEAAFKPFERVKPERKKREYFYSVLQVHLSVTKDMLEAIREACEKEGINTSELIRRALTPYLGL